MAATRAQRVQQIAIFVALAELLVIPVFWVEGLWIAVVPLACGMLMMGVCLLLARLGKIEHAARLLVLSVTVMAGALQWLDQGLRDASVLAFPVVLILAGMLVGLRTFVVLLLSMIAFLGFMTLATEFWGIRQNRAGYNPLEHWRDASIILVVGGLSVWFIVNDLRNLLRQLNEQIDKYQESQRNLSHVSQHDLLTDLPNRNFERQSVEQALALAARQGRRIALLLLNLDGFKAINDARGQALGDALLKQVALRLRQAMRGSDLVSRHGGDEFVVCVTDVNEVGDVTKAADKVLASFAPPFLIQEQEVATTACLGLALYPDDGEDYDTLVQHADLAMSKAKRSGRNSYCFFDYAMQSAILERRKLEDELRAGLLAHEFVLYFQPQVDASGRTVAAEALVRWRHPERGLVSPAEFIPVAEESGLILPLGQWVLESACKQLAWWSSQSAFADLVLSVNISALQLEQSDFVVSVMQTVERTAADPHRLKLELTESLLLRNVDATIQKMKTLNAMGVRFSLDDFGTGYSSLAYLSRLPLCQLKIDRSFVQDIETREDAVAICAATVSLAHGLKLTVVAEGVETQAQRYFLSTVHRCDLIQGYLYSPALPVAAFEDYVRRKPHA